MIAQAVPRGTPCKHCGKAIPPASMRGRRVYCLRAACRIARSRATWRKYRARHLDLSRARCRQYAREHPEITRRWSRENPEAMRASARRAMAKWRAKREPCQYCEKPIRTSPHPKGWQRKYCDRLRCRRARRNRASLASYHRLGAAGPERQRATYDPEKRHGRYKALTPQQRAAWLVTQRRYRKAHRADLNAKKRATYDPAARRAHYLATGT